MITRAALLIELRISFPSLLALFLAKRFFFGLLLTTYFDYWWSPDSNALELEYA